METRNAMMLVLMVAGCTDGDSAVGKRLPGILLDDTSRAGIASANPTPQCGYDYYNDDGPMPESHRHVVTTFFYDRDGLITADHDVDDSGAVLYEETIDYNAMGQPIHLSILKAKITVGDYYNVYDSFGLVVRRSRDIDHDGVDDSFTVYGYGPDHQRVSAHSEGKSIVVDSVYSYDEMGRVARVENTSTDEDLTFTLDYTYDDTAHTMSTIGTKPAGVYYNANSTYNSDGLLESDMNTYMDPSTGVVTAHSTNTMTYNGKDMIAARSVWASVPSDSEPGRTITERYEYHYGDCERDPSR